MGFMSAFFGLYEEATYWLLKALPLARELEGPTQLAICLIDLGYGIAQIGRPSEGMPYIEEGLALVECNQIHPFEVSANVAVGAVAGLLGDLERQRAAFDRALFLTPLRTAPGPASMHRRLISHSLQETGQIELALEVLAGGLAALRAANLDLAESDLLLAVGTTWLACDGYAEAHETLTASLTIVLRHPSDHREPALRHHLGQALTGLGRQDEARREWEQALTQYRRVGDPRAEEVAELLAGLEVEAE
jgi:tetratricopeptide (TPR) repeat protein